MIKLSDVKKCRERLEEIRNSLNYEYEDEREFKTMGWIDEMKDKIKAITFAISILDKLIAGKLVEKYYENDEVTDDTQCDLYGDR